MTRGFTLASTSTYSRGFVIDFASGYSVSVRFDSGNYCANSHLLRDEPETNEIGYLASPDAEVAIITPDDRVMEPASHVPPDAFSDALTLVSRGKIDEAHAALMRLQYDAAD